MDVEIKLEGIEEAKMLLDPNRIRKILSETFYLTAQDTKEGLRDEMKQVFDRPTPYTLRNLNVRSPGWMKFKSAATQESLSVIIGFDITSRGPSDYLKPQVFGGSRPMKRSEQYLHSYWTPGQGMAKNQYGNVSGSKIVQILSALRLFPEVGYAMNVIAESKRRNKKPRNYFIVRKGNRGLHPGVWEKMASGKVKPMLIFINGPSYHIRFKFFEVGKKIFFNNIQRRFEQAMSRMY
jgi:hypothetical protein